LSLKIIFKKEIFMAAEVNSLGFYQPMNPSDDNPIDQLFSGFNDPLDEELFRDAVIDECGHTFSRKSIEDWAERINKLNLATQDQGKENFIPLTCPISRRVITLESLRPNFAINSLIDNLREQNLLAPSTSTLEGRYIWTGKQLAKLQPGVQILQQKYLGLQLVLAQRDAELKETKESLHGESVKVETLEREKGALIERKEDLEAKLERLSEQNDTLQREFEARIAEQQAQDAAINHVDIGNAVSLWWEANIGGHPEVVQERIRNGENLIHRIFSNVGSFFTRGAS
jgi:hypothetical protein